MPTQSHPRLPRTRRFIILIAALLSAIGLSVATGAAAHASVYGSCDVSGCSAAASADSTWASLGFPTSRGWYDWPNGQCSYAGGEYYNYDGQLPAGDTYYEYEPDFGHLLSVHAVGSRWSVLMAGEVADLRH